MKKEDGIRFWFLIGGGVLLTILLIAGQTFSLISYNTAVLLGLQESIEEVGKVGVAFAKGFAFGDTFFYLPFMVGGIIGLLKGKQWGHYVMLIGLAITVYWPAVHLYAIYIDKEAFDLGPEKYLSYSIILPIIILYGLWGMWYIYKGKIR
ncbi:MAG: hypothetical protein ACR2MT_04435 [Aurantibacter sp.]